MKKVIFVMIVVLSVAIFVGCTGTADQGTAEPAAEEPAAEEPAEGKTYKIGVSMDDLNTAFWVANLEGMRSKAAELGNVELIELMAGGDASKQNQQISEMISIGVDAIICSPKDGAAIEVAVNECNDAGVPIVMNNRPVQGDSTPDLQVLSDNYTMAMDAMQWFVDKAKEEGKTYNALLLIGNLGDENAVERYEGHMEIISANTDVINLVVEVPSEWDHAVALAGLQNALQANPEIDLIITPSDFLFTPIQSALEQIDRWVPRGEEGHVAIVSFDGDETGCQLLNDGYSWCDAAQAATGTGEICVEWAVKLANGEKPDDVIMRDPGVIIHIDNMDEVKDQVWGFSSVE